MPGPPPILLLDNHDSFTFNLYQLIAAVSGTPPTVATNDGITLDEVVALGPAAVVLSPGPGHPGVRRDFGVCAEVLDALDLPVLGVCLGHQGLASAAGGTVPRAPEPMHGRVSPIYHDGSALFAGIPQGFAAVRYHSLIVGEPVPDELEVIAWTADGLPMGLRHRRLLRWGVQFHPESISTEHGPRLIANFLDACGWSAAAARAATPARPPGDGAAPPLPSAATRHDGMPTRPAPLQVLHRQLDVEVDAEDAFCALYSGATEAFWLDSSMNEPSLCRFSFMGAYGGPHSALVEYRHGEQLLRRTPGGVEQLEVGLFDHLSSELDRLATAGPDLEFDFTCGFVGYLGYEMKAECGHDAPHRAAHPDAGFILADRVLAFDHLRRRVHLLALAAHADAEAEAWLASTEARLRTLATAPPVTEPPVGAEDERDPALVTLRRPREGYLADIDECLAAIAAGESYEVCLTNQLTAAGTERALDLYRILRRVNPAPYAAYLRLGAMSVLCSSPECFLRVRRDRTVTSRPIKGTRARGHTEEADALERAALESSVKDRAENLMIVDLLRNDLGSVCEVGSVHVPSLMRVETFATVHQLVSTVRGTLAPGVGSVDCIKAAFPGGSMTGAPKKRTLEILDRLEPGPRGVYSGSIGFLSVNGCADLNIVIRTAVVTAEETTIGVGGAIVALSSPEEEFEETLLKARSILDAMGRAGTAAVTPLAAGAG